MKRNLLIGTLCYFSVLTLFFFSKEKISNPVNVPSGAFSFGEKEEQQKRQDWQWKMLRDPATGKIPEGIRGKEIAFAKTLPTDNDFNTKNGWGAKTPNEHPFILQGPYNVGGRTRALAIDITNENVIFAGSVSGGLWRSADGGNTWGEVTAPTQHLGVTAIVQDKRAGKTNNWYFSTGEGYGTSASGGSAFFLGDGLFKSTDGGLTWTPVDATDNGSPQTFTTNWQVIWNIATHPSDSDTLVFAAAYGAIYRTLNGGTTWGAALSSGFSASYFSDVASTSEGTVYGTMSSDGGKKGIWRSPDGYSAFINITPINWVNGTDTLNFPPVYDRNVIGIDPNNENIVYFFAYTPGYGKPTTDFQGDTEWVSLWKYEYLSGNGSDTGGMWTDLSENLPYDGSIFGNLVVQGSYDMVVRVMPGNSSTVFIGGTNLYRSTDGFTSPNNTTQLGGYGVGATMPFFTTYPNHHPDQHNLAFLPSNPNILISSADGGIYKTEDCLAQNVSWTSLNKGYFTSQFYTVAIDHGTPGSNVVTGGLQDWGSWWTNSADPFANWTFPSTGDGSFCAVADGGGSYYYSRQGGQIMKATLDNDGIVTAFRRMDPIGANKSNYMFIAPFILDPSDNNVMYLTEGENLWRNDDLSQIPLDGNWDTISSGWFKYSFSLTDSLSDITALACSKNNVAHRLYFGTDKKKIFKMDSANTGDPAPVEITGSTMPANGYVSCIAVDPGNADKLIVLFSNYSVYSIFYSEDAGASWKKVAGNLEQYSSGTGNGPSCRWASILPEGNGTLYLVGTSTGLYATDTLIPDSTVWVQQGTNIIGNVVVTMIDVRESDGFIAIATHGNGVFTNHLPVEFSVNNATNCSTACDGSSTAGVSGGVPPYTFLWNSSAGNQTSATATGLCPGLYTVTVSDSNSFIGIGHVEIFSSLTAAASVVNAKNSTSATGSASVSASGGTFPYTYLWSTGQTTSSIDSLFPGTYSVTITDSAGCTTNCLVPVGVYVNFLTINISLDNASYCYSPCNGNASVVAIGGISPYTFLWNESAENQTTSTATGLCQGTYSVTAYDAVGYFGVGNMVIGSNIIADIVTADAQDSTSLTGSASVSATGGASPYSYLWSTGQTSSLINSLPAGSYSVTITDGNGCNTIATAIVGQWIDAIRDGDIVGSDFLVYPNPVTGTVTFSLLDSEPDGKKALVEIRDVPGHLIYRSSLVANLSIKIDVSNLPSGIYYCTLINNRKKTTKKILVFGR